MANIKQLYEDNNKTVEAYPRVWLPVGSLYWNENDISADISKYFVGTWVRVKDVFILAAGDIYVAKSSGGEAMHTLVESEMPSHAHQGVVDVTDLGISNEGNLPGVACTYQWNTIGSYIKTRAAGGSQAHNNMPPYYVAYCWKRTA